MVGEVLKFSGALVGAGAYALEKYNDTLDQGLMSVEWETALLIATSLLILWLVVNEWSGSSGNNSGGIDL